MTYTGGTGVDNVTARLGADIIDLGADTAADVVTILGATDTSLATGIVVGAVPANGVTVNTSGMDKITNFGTGDSVVFNNAAFVTVAAADAIVRNSGIVGAAITPGISWIKNLTWNIGAGLRHQYAEVRIWRNLNFFKPTIKSRVYHGPGISDLHSLTDTIPPT